MKILGLRLVVNLFLIFSSMCVIRAEAEKQQAKKTYLVRMDKSTMPESFNDHLLWYKSSLKSVSDSASMLYTYNNVIHGFATSLTPEEAEALKNQLGIISVQPEVRYELHTTRTPHFLGLGQNPVHFPASDAVSEVVIGVLDTGVWPESRSFHDKGLPPVPKRWKGECQEGNNFNSSNCNKKLIGARFFSKGYEAQFGPINETAESNSPRDDEGHGTHTSTTVAGTAVKDANLFGFGTGLARGMATQARVAAYKVCWLGGCFSSDILAAMDKAVEDGVNVLSLSLGGNKRDYYADPIAIGAFTATAHGIFVSCSAGNSGPYSASLFNIAPWIITVGAGTLDREFPAYVNLGNGENFTGDSLYNGKPLPDSVPIAYAANVSYLGSDSTCLPGSLDPAKVKGKIVVCEGGESTRVGKGEVVKAAGGVGMILTNTKTYGEELLADAHFLPSSHVGYKAGEAIIKYIGSDPNPTATITPGGTKLNIQPSPVVAAFSSRGPNPVTPEILKPDLIAPGINILAGWSRAASPSNLETDKRKVNFNIISGTSMSCPHVSGLAALVKAAHPEWSPAAIRSALMTTAYSTCNNGKPIIDIASGKPATAYHYGAGHVNPMAALDPGLVYDAIVDDYLYFLCAINYTSSQIKKATNREYTCDSSKSYRIGDVNYPSFSVPFKAASKKRADAGGTSTLKYRRTLTNVGKSATYKVSVSSKTPSVKILVEPESLSFKKQNEKKSYTLTFTASSMPSGTTHFARLEWSDGKHIVGSSIVLTWT